jgi:hypothetical protein
MKYIRNAQILILIAVSITAISFLSCEKQSANTVTADPLLRKGGNGRGPNSPGSGPGTSNDSLLAACNILFTDSGQFYPTVQLTNLTWRKQICYSYDPATGGYTFPYEVLAISFDTPVIPGKTPNCYMLFADQCQGRVVCNKMNGLTVSQVTYCSNTTTLYINLSSWLNPNVPLYTGYIYVGTTDGCISLSQQFTFEPPRIL